MSEAPLSETILGADRDEARIELEVVLVGLEVVVVEADREAVAEVVAEAGAGVVFGARVIDVGVARGQRVD